MSGRADLEDTHVGSDGPRGDGPPLGVSEFAALPEEDGVHIELSGGRLVREPAPGPRHGNLAARLAALLRQAGEETGAGLVFVETGFILSTSPATVRVPDVAYVSADRVPEEGLTHRFWSLAPDLVVEVVSPGNLASRLQQKALEYLDAGARLVWLVDPTTGTVTVLRSRTQIRILGAGDVLDGGRVLPELRLPVEEVMAPGEGAR